MQQVMAIRHDSIEAYQKDVETLNMELISGAEVVACMFVPKTQTIEAHVVAEAHEIYVLHYKDP